MRYIGILLPSLAWPGLLYVSHQAIKILTSICCCFNKEVTSLGIVMFPGSVFLPFSQASGGCFKINTHFHTMINDGRNGYSAYLRSGVIGFP